MLSLLRILAILTLGLSTGVAFSHVLQAAPKAALSPEVFLAAQNTLFTRESLVMTVVECLALVLPVAAAVIAFLRGERGRTLNALLLVMFCVLGMLAIRFGMTGQIDAAVSGWTIKTLPENWQMLRDRWGVMQGIRFAFGLLGLCVLLLDIVLPPASGRNRRR